MQLSEPYPSNESVVADFPVPVPFFNVYFLFINPANKNLIFKRKINNQLKSICILAGLSPTGQPRVELMLAFHVKIMHIIMISGRD